MKVNAAASSDPVTLSITAIEMVEQRESVTVGQLMRSARANASQFDVWLAPQIIETSFPIGERRPDSDARPFVVRRADLIPHTVYE